MLALKLEERFMDTQQARWIWSDLTDPAPRNRFTYFRTTFDLRLRPGQAAIRFAADSNARLWVNGVLVRRKVTRYHEERITAEVIEVGHLLVQGTNTLVVLHHNWGPIVTFQRSANLHAGLWLDSEFCRTGPSWRYLQAPEFTVHADQVIGLIGDARVRYPVVLDGRKAPGQSIHGAGFDDSGWPGVSVVEHGPWPQRPDDVETPGQREYLARPMNVLAAGRLDRQPPVEAAPLEIAAGIRTSRCLPDQTVGAFPWSFYAQAGESRFVTVDFGLPVHGYPALELGTTPGGTILDLGYCELYRSLYSGAIHVDESGWLNPEGVVGKGYADRYLTRHGFQQVEIPEERTARWMTLHFHFSEAGLVTINSLGIVSSQYPTQALGSFECGDHRVDQIVKLGLIHAKVTMTDSYVDTPGREDGQWLEDAVPRALLTSRWFGDTALRNLMLRTYAESQGEDGNFHSFPPSNYPAYPSRYDWSVQWVALLWDDYQWHGSPERVRRYWPVLQKYWQGLLAHVHDGLWVTPLVFADIRVGLHPGPGQSSGIVTPWIIERLRWSVELARAVGEDSQAEAWSDMTGRLVSAFRKHHVVPASGGVPIHVADRCDPSDSGLARGYSQAGQTVAVYSDLLTKDESAANLNYCFAEPDGSPAEGVTRWNNPTYFERSLKALSHVGLTDRAVRHLVERYGPYLPAHPANLTPLRFQGPYGGPLPEYWLSGSAQPEDDTGSHGWGAIPLLWLHECLLGVTIAEPGGAKLEIAPQLGGLPFVQGHTVTPKGVVWVSCDPQQRRLEVTLPKGTTAKILCPWTSETPSECSGPGTFFFG